MDHYSNSLFSDRNSDFAAVRNTKFGKFFLDGHKFTFILESEPSWAKKSIKCTGNKSEESIARGSDREQRTSLLQGSGAANLRGKRNFFKMSKRKLRMFQDLVKIHIFGERNVRRRSTFNSEEKIFKIMIGSKNNFKDSRFVNVFFLKIAENLWKEFRGTPAHISTWEKTVLKAS